MTAFDEPMKQHDLIKTLLICLLFKLGGQISLSLGEIEKINKEFPSIRFGITDDAHGEIALMPDEKIMLTLRSREQTIEAIRKMLEGKE